MAPFVPGLYPLQQGSVRNSLVGQQDKGRGGAGKQPPGGEHEPAVTELIRFSPPCSLFYLAPFILPSDTWRPPPHLTSVPSSFTIETEPRGAAAIDTRLSLESDINTKWRKRRARLENVVEARRNRHGAEG